MPMLDVQRRHAEVFRIRLGDKGPKGAPRKLTDQIRVTAGGEAIVRAFVDVYGGQVQAFTEPASKHRFQAYLPTSELAVMVLPGQSVEQWWELWRGSVCERRCDGEVEQLSGGACRCTRDPYERAGTQGQCSPMTRLNVLCPDVDVVGAGSLVSHGMIAAETLPQSIAVAEAALSRGLMVPAVLRVVEHRGKRHFIFPQLEIVGVSLNTLAAGGVPSVPQLAWVQRHPSADHLEPPAPREIAAAPDPRPQPALPGEPDPAAEGVDWVERVNALPLAGGVRRAAKDAMDREFGWPPAVPADRARDAESILAAFGEPAPSEDLGKLRRGLMAEASKAFPLDGHGTVAEQKARQTAARHALTYVVLDGRWVSSNDMTADELAEVTTWLRHVTDGAVTVTFENDAWVCRFGSREVIVPPEAA